MMAKTRDDGYRDDLAYIHDVGFGGFAREAAPWLLEQFRARLIDGGLVIDLGCGSGIWAEELARAGYDVLGYDISPAMVTMARRRVPSGTFKAQSFIDAELPSCAAVTAIGEIFNYLFDERNSAAQLYKLLGRIHGALAPGGLLVFDGAEPGRAGPTGSSSSFRFGEDWACLFSATEDRGRNLLVRDITTFRKSRAALYRRDHEIHRLRLFDRGVLLKELRAAGFRARVVRSYGAMQFPAGYLGIVARKA